MNKNPLLAGILSLILPGLGYIYVGNIIVGFIEMIMFFITVLISFYSYFYHSVFPGIPELALINLWVFFYFIWIPAAYNLYRTVKKKNKAKDRTKIDNEINEEISFGLTCPECNARNIENTETCQKCGKNLKETLFFSKGRLSDMPDVEMTKRFLIEYKNNIFGKRSGKINKYYLYKIENVEINDNIQYGLSPMPFKYVALEFKYGDKKNYYKSKKTVYIHEDDVYDLIKALKIRKIPYTDNYHVELFQ